MTVLCGNPWRLKPRRVDRAANGPLMAPRLSSRLLQWLSKLFSSYCLWRLLTTEASQCLLELLKATLMKQRRKALKRAMISPFITQVSAKSFISEVQTWSMKYCSFIFWDQGSPAGIQTDLKAVISITISLEQFVSCRPRWLWLSNLGTRE